MSTSPESRAPRLRPPPFTPRPRSQTSSYPDSLRYPSTRSTTPSLTSSISSKSTRSTTPSLQPPGTPKYKATISAESRIGTKGPKNLHVRHTSRPPSPRKRVDATPSPTPFIHPVDPEAGLLDWKSLEPDLSAEIDERDLAGISSSTPEDKVLVSVRVKPPSGEGRDNQAWNISPDENLITLDPRHARSTGKATEHRFDAVLTGSDNRLVYQRTARSHVIAAMEGYNSLVFAYGQTASGKTFTLMGDENEPGIIPRALKDVFGYIRKNPTREFLLRASYLEIYNETVYDLLSPSSSGSLGPTITDAGVVNLREEVVTSLKGIKDVLERGDSSRRTASTDWNERSSRSHSVFRLVIESREVGIDGRSESPSQGVPQTPGGTRLQTRGGRSVQSSVLSLIDLAGSEKATSDKERTREGKYINTSLLTLGTVIGTLAENAAKGKSDHVPYRNSKLTRMLQPSLAGNARVSVICTLNGSTSAIGETTSTLGFATRIKKVQLHAVKKEIIDTDALLERYRKEIEELKARLEERERDAPARNRRLSARQQIDESRALNDMSGRIKQLTKLILTSETVNESKGDQSRPSSPSKLDFSQSPYELQKELLLSKEEIERQATLILSLEASLEQRAVVPLDAPEFEKDAKIIELWVIPLYYDVWRKNVWPDEDNRQKQVKEYEFVTKRYEENLGEPLRAVKEDVEKEWAGKLEALEEKLRASDSYVLECERGLEKERQIRLKLEEEKRALVAFVSDLDSALPSLRGLVPPLTMGTSHSYTGTMASSPFRPTLSALTESNPNSPTPSPVKTKSPRKKSSVSIPHGNPTMNDSTRAATLFDQTPEDDLIDGDASFTVHDKENHAITI
ncbi:hypothetical protein BS47DRAFT_1488703 [Hydnum rufescens UP504]|uniref:Kinesin-like protein n=1 Tax=Hydnum rufescens UP504 TaxID=1448309 RepID=A0A9P6ALX2_9AGAM|nr:hypothetical protein BS47DRAFT_1488703 [Hydnum rufescens UP504]